MPGELSDQEEEVEEEVSSSLDRAVPRTALLDCQGAKHRAELVHRSQGLATRHRPSGEGLRAGVLRREESSSSITTSNITSTSSLNSSQASSNVSPKNPLGLAVNIHNRGVGPTRVQVSPAKETTLNQPQSHSLSSLSNSHSISVEASGNSPPQPSSHSLAAPGKPH